MTFQDIFKSSFLERVDAIPLLDMSLSLILALFIGMFIFFIYKKSFCGVMYSAGFGATLIALTLITTLLIMAVTTNVVLSLGMVGALSIVRFRTAIKEPMDIAFLFWSISVGIVLAAGLIPLAVMGSAFIGAVLLFLSKGREIDTPYILVVHSDSAAAEEQVRQALQKSAKRHSLKSKSVSKGGVELNFEVRLKENDSSFVDVLSETEGIRDVILVSYNGDYMG